jgi:8-oxo-dGTP diphosphatase
MNKIEVESFGIIPLSNQNGVWKVLLILHREGSHWSFPKGRSNAGELPLECAKRELKEETGLEIVQLLQEEPFLEQYKFRRKHNLIEKKVFYFPAIVTGKLQLQEQEIRDARWLPLETALDQLTFKEARALLLQVMHNRHLA